METIAETRPRAQQTKPSAWSRGIEKILADAPAVMSSRLTTYRDDRIDTYLMALLEDGAGCRQHTWSTIYRHTAHPGTLSAKPCTDSCHVRGEPTCRRDKARADLFKHRERFEAAYPKGAVRVRLTGPPEWGPAELIEEVQKWERRRPVKRELPPFFGQYHVDDRGWYGLTLLVPDQKTAYAFADLWPDAKGFIYESGADMPDAFEAAVDLKVEAEAGVFELVDFGALTPGRAREILESEFGRRRTKFGGGFLTVTSKVMTSSSDASDITTSMEPDSDAMCEAPEAEASTRESLLNKVQWAEKELDGHWIPDLSIEMILRDVIASADRLHLPEVTVAAEKVLGEMPGDHFDCPIHSQCRLLETDLRIKTRYLKKAADHGRADWLGSEAMYLWTDETWPGWEDRSTRSDRST